MKSYNRLFCPLPRLLAAGLFLLGLVSCGGGNQNDEPNPVVLLADETLKPIMSAQLEAFKSGKERGMMGKKVDHDLPVEYLPGVRAYNRFMSKSDTDYVLVGTRSLREKELNWWSDQRQWKPSTNSIAIDAVVPILHPDNAHQQMTRGELRGILRGDTHTWGALSGQADQDSIVVVFDRANASTRTTVEDSLLGGKPIAKEVAYDAGGPAKVIEYVAENPNAIGFIGYNWLSDGDDPTVQQRRKRVKPLQFPHPAKEGQFISLYSEYAHHYLRAGLYPLRRTVYFLNGVPRQSVGTRFESYIVSGKGQRVFWKAGLFPSQGITRELEIKEEELETIQPKSEQ